MAHYYKLNGDTCYEVIGKNGKLRPTTIRDARSLNLVPSVTTIMDVQAKPALTQWVQNQIIEAAIASPFSDEWYEKGWKDFILKKSKEIGNKAAKRGTEIHDSMEHYFKTGTTDHNVEYTQESISLLNSQFADFSWFAEQSFAHEDGFGGKVDLYGVNDAFEYIIVDFKTKDKTDVKDIVQFDDHRIQLAAYQVGLQLPSNTRRFNLFISINAENPGQCKLVECKEFVKYRDMFYHLLGYWQLKNNYTTVR